MQYLLGVVLDHSEPEDTAFVLRKAFAAQLRARLTHRVLRTLNYWSRVRHRLEKDPRLFLGHALDSPSDWDPTTILGVVSKWEEH